MFLFLFFVYYIILDAPSGLVDTSLNGRVLQVGDETRYIPKHIDPRPACVLKRGGKLVFKFNEISSSF